MDRWRRFSFRLRGLWTRQTQDADLIEEMQGHLDRLIAGYLEDGLSLDEARRRAAMRFGSLPSLHEQARDERRLRVIEYMARDARYAIRQLLAHRGFAATAILSLSLGIGASVSIFSAVNAILLRDLALPDADQLAVVRKGPVGGEPDLGLAPAHALEVADRLRPYAQGVPFTLTEFVLRQEGGAARVSGVRVGSSFFRTIGVTPALGRDFVPADDRSGAGTVAIISHGLWERLFASDPRTVGRTLQTETETLFIIGVMPSTFRFPPLLGMAFRPEVWTPLAFSPGEASDRGAGYMSLLLRRPPHVSWPAIQHVLDASAYAYERQNPATYGGQRLAALPAHELVVGKSRPMLLLLWAAVSSLLLIACANTANVVLSRTAARSRELAVRVSLGATRGRLLSQLVTESLVLAVSASAIGLMMAAAVVRVGRYALSDFLPRADEMTIDGTVLLFTIGVAWLTSLAVGILPAQRVTAIAPRDALGSAGPRGTTEGRWAVNLRQALLVAQIAIAVLLGTTAVLLGRSLVAVLHADLGFDPDALLTCELSLPAQGRSKSDTLRFYQDLAARLVSRPQVRAAGAMNLLPLSGADFGWAFLSAGSGADGSAMPVADIRVVIPGTLETLGVSILRGRSFTDADRTESQPVAVVNAALARRIWPGEDAVGKQMKLAGPVAALPWMTVVGVADDARLESPDRAATPAIYRPLAQHAWRDMSVVIRTTGRPADAIPAIRQEVARLGGGAQVVGVHEFGYFLSRTLASRRVTAILIVTFAGIALALALLGVYGVFAYAVATRTREIGVRIALGAAPRRIVRMMLGRALLLGGLGLGAGIAGVYATRPLVEAQLFELYATDFTTLLLVSSVVLVTALIACYVPVCRAARIDPTIALRAD